MLGVSNASSAGMVPEEEAIMNDPSRVQMSGPLLPFAAGFREELDNQGYRPDAVCGQLQRWPT